jgi:hypothetical protein
VLREAFEHTAEYSDEKTKFTLERYWYLFSSLID